MYLARANQHKTIEELMEELKVGEHPYMAVFIFGHYVWFVTLVSPDFSKLTGRTHAQSN